MTPNVGASAPAGGGADPLAPGAPVFDQTSASDPNAAAPASSAAFQALPPLDQLLAPIALYPDPLIALILPASTYPADLQAAASFVAAKGDPSQIDGQSWNESVKDLAHYPEVVQWMNSNPDWTQQVGAAFASSPADVMNAIQDLRSRAKSAGTLTDSPQQAVVADGNDIEIEPAQPDVIYVPRYDPDVVYFGPGFGYYGGPYFTYGSPYPMGIWLGFGFDWQGRGLWAGNWYQWRRDNGGWRRPFNPARAGFAASVNAHAWHPPANAPRAMAAGARTRFTQPRPMAGAPQFRRAPAANNRTNQPPRPTPAPQLRPEELRNAAAPRAPRPEERAPAPAERVDRAAAPGREPERVEERAPAREGERERPPPARKEPPPDDRERRKDN